MNSYGGWAALLVLTVSILPGLGGAEACNGFPPVELGDGSGQATFYVVQDQLFPGYFPFIYEETNGHYTVGADPIRNLQRGGTGIILGTSDYCAPPIQELPPDRLIH